MSGLNKVRLAIAGIIVLVVGVAGLRAYLVGAGMVHVMFPPDDIGTIRVDGHEVAPWDTRSRVRTYSVEQGSHEVSVERRHGQSKATELPSKTASPIR